MCCKPSFQLYFQLSFVHITIMKMLLRKFFLFVTCTPYGYIAKNLLHDFDCSHYV